MCITGRKYFGHWNCVTPFEWSFIDWLNSRVRKNTYDHFFPKKITIPMSKLIFSWNTTREYHWDTTEERTLSDIPIQLSIMQGWQRSGRVSEIPNSLQIIFHLLGGFCDYFMQLLLLPVNSCNMKRFFHRWKWEGK